MIYAIVLVLIGRRHQCPDKADQFALIEKGVFCEAPEGESEQDRGCGLILEAAGTCAEASHPGASSYGGEGA